MSLLDYFENISPEPEERLRYQHVQGGNVPGGHNVIVDGDKKPFITPVKETNSIPLRRSDVVVDIGAYVGTYALRCARFPVREVRAFEPTSATMDILRLSPLPNLKLFQAAVVGDARTSVEFNVSLGIGVTNSMIGKWSGDARTIMVPAVSYEEAVRGATIVKIDVEGAEYSYPIVQPSLRAVIIDFHPIPRARNPWRNDARRIIQELEDAGFVAVVTPDFSNGWTRAGSWLREVPNAPEEEFTPMTTGQLCCGCGTPITGATQVALCPDCCNLWLPKHREGYALAQKITP